MKQAIKLSLFYRSLPVSLIRIIIAVFLFYACTVSIQMGEIPTQFLGILCIFVMLDLFMRFKVGRIHARLPISENTKRDPMLSITRIAYTPFITEASLSAILKKYLQFSQIEFILDKADIALSDIQALDIEKNEVLNYAYAITEKTQGKFVTSMDVFCAYLLLSEPTTKLLFSKNLKEEDLFSILHWAKKEYPKAEYQEEQLLLGGYGEGIGEFLIDGWTPETRKYTKEITKEALLTKPLLVGREKEFKTLTEILSKKQNNNVVLVGPPGSGKETMVEALAYKSFLGILPDRINNKRVYQLLFGLFLSGAKEKGEVEKRLQDIIDEVSHAGNVILYIPDFQILLGDGGEGIDISASILPFLQNGKLPIIATMPPDLYKIYAPKNPIFQVMQEVLLESPEAKEAFYMVMKKASFLENQYGIVFTYLAVKEILRFADRYVQDVVLPGSASILLEDAANFVLQKDSSQKSIKGKPLVLQNDVVEKIEEKTKIAVSKPQKEEVEKLLHLEDEIHKRIVDQEKAVSAIAQSMRRLRAGLTADKKPISFLFLGPTGVGKTETAKALAAISFGSESALLRFDMSEYANEDGVRRLLGSLPGEGNELGELMQKVHDHPYSVILFDEFEKANPLILNLFLQILDEGRITDNKGRVISFANAIIIATSNAASEFIREQISENKKESDEVFQKNLFEHLLKNNIFRPELLNRFDKVVVFSPLGEKEIREIVIMQLEKLIVKLKEQDVTISFDESVVDKIAKEGFDNEFGARPIKRYIQDTIEEVLAQKILKEEIGRGDVVACSIDPSGSLLFSK